MHILRVFNYLSVQRFMSTSQMSQTELTQHYITKFEDHAVKFYEAMHNGDCEKLSKYWILLIICKSEQHFAPVLQNNQDNKLAKDVVRNILNSLEYSRMNISATTSPDQLLRTLPTVKEAMKHKDYMLTKTVFWKICNNDMNIPTNAINPYVI